MGRKRLCGDLGLAVPWRHPDHHPVDLAALDALELLAQEPVNLARPVAGVTVLGEA